MKNTTKAIVGAALLVTSHAKAEPPPCAKGSEVGPMLVMSIAPTPIGIVRTITKIGEAVANYDYVKQTITMSFKPNPENNNVTAIRPDHLKIDAAKGIPVGAAQVDAVYKDGHKVVMRPNIESILGSYEDHKLACKGVKPGVQATPS
jgi:hypothetical protein